MSDLTPLEAVEILEHPEKHLQGKISVQPSLLRGAPDCVGGKIGFSQEYWGAVNQAASCLRAIAAGEYKRVVHGEWLNFYNDFSTAECSECGECYEVSPDEKPREDYFNAFKQFYKFCPSCGALMDDPAQSQHGGDLNDPR
jgi:Pyruvate/2-oxoacid:ferredoxin oxidoreductase delta subunit